MRTQPGRFPTAAVLALALLSACKGRPEPAPEPAATASPATAAELPRGCDPVAVPDGRFPLQGDPRACKGGEIVLETNSYPTHLNYYGPERDSYHRYVWGEAMFNQLVSIDLNTLEMIPELATSWEELDGGKTLVFHLDPDARWSDGKPVTAADVVATWELIESPDVVEVVHKVEMDKFARPQALDDHTVKFVAKRASWRNLNKFDDIFILPAHAINPKTYLKDWQFVPPVVSGQYTVGPFESGKFFSLQRRTDFWGEGKRPFIGTGNFDTITYKIIFDNDIAFDYLKKGEIDFYPVMKAQRWHEESDFDKVKKGWIQKMRWYHKIPQPASQMAFNLTHPLFKDVRVRKALFYLFDREYLHDQQFFHEYKNKDSYFPNSIYENPANEKVTFSPEKGLTLLQEAGWSQKDKEGVLVKDGKRLEFQFIYIHPGSERIYTPVQETFRKYGVKMNLKLMQPPAWVKVSQEKTFEVIFANWSGSPFPEIRDQWHSQSADAKDTANIVRFKDPEVDRLIEEYELEPDLEKRGEIGQKIDDIVYRAVPYLLDWHPVSFRLLWWDKFGMPDWGSYAMLDIRPTVWKTWWHEPQRAARLEAAMKADRPVPLAPAENTSFK